MAGNTFGTLFRLTTFGESHGAAIGGIVDGCPPGVEIDMAFLQSELDRRRPGQSAIVTQRRESDTAQLLSGVFEGKTTGMPIAIFIPNEDQRSKDYDHIAAAFRPGHADYTWQAKYGIRDHRGGGRSSARETAARVAGGAIAKMLLRTYHIDIQAYVSQVGEIALPPGHTFCDLSQTESNEVRCPQPETAERMIAHIKEVKKAGDTIGGVVSCVIKGCPVGLGEPVFDRLHADLAKAMLSINAARGFEYGSGFEGVKMRGSQHNDPLGLDEQGYPATRTNHAGGILGGVSNGMDIYFNVAFKPVATIVQEQHSLDAQLQPAIVTGKGRHDPCVVPRAVPIVEAMAALVLADHLLRAKAINAHWPR